MTNHIDISGDLLRSLIRSGQITFAGNARLRIYGSLRCRSGKTMKRENRVFFANETEATLIGYRPCGHCMKTLYDAWKHHNDK